MRIFKGIFAFCQHYVSWCLLSRHYSVNINQNVSQFFLHIVRLAFAIQLCQGARSTSWWWLVRGRRGVAKILGGFSANQVRRWSNWKPSDISVASSNVKMWKVNKRLLIYSTSQPTHARIPHQSSFFSKIWKICILFISKRPHFAEETFVPY